MYKAKHMIVVVFLFLISTTGYSQWNAIGPDSGETSNCLSFDDNTGNLLLGTAEGFWYYNTATGIWTRREDVGWIGRSVFSIAAHPTIAGRIITGRMNAFFKGYIETTSDWGVTGDPVYFANGGNVTDVKNVPGSPNTFFACTWPDIDPGEFLKSTDGGLNWVLLPNYIHYALTEIAIDKNNPNVMYISGDERVTKSTDGGTTWNVTSTGLPSGLGVYAVSVSPGNSQVLLASNDNGIYRSTNGGGNWTLVYNSACQHFEFNPVNPQYAVAVTFSPYKILISSDAGAVWTDFTSNFSGDELSDLAFNTSGTMLYVSTGMDGVYTHDFSFVPVELVSFTAAFNSGTITLQWETATELNNHGFEIERSVEKSPWTVTGFVKGAGTSTTPVKYSYSDNPGLNKTSSVKYRLKQVDLDGSYKYSDEVEVIFSPQVFSLEQNYPNPFNPATTIRYSIGQDQLVEIIVYDVIGNEVTTLVNKHQPAGVYEINFDGSGLTSGMYFYKLKAGDYTEVKKMTLIK